MRLPDRVWLPALLLVTSTLGGAPLFHYQVAGERPGAWPRILASAGLVRGPGGITVVTGSAGGQDAEAWLGRAKAGAVLILDRDSLAAAAFGFLPDRARRHVPVRSVVDSHNPNLQIVWERAVDVAAYKLPEKAVVFARERWNDAPLMAGVKYGAGAALWLAVLPGEKGHERFP